MTITVTHPFVSAKGDGSDATVVRPSNWNASHKIEMAANRVVGRLTAGTGPAEELPVTAYMIGLLNTADFAALAVALGLPTTGDAKLTYKPSADTGWIFANDGTIGDAGSGSTVAASNTLALFTLFYDTMEYATPLQTSSGAATTRALQGSAATAFGAKCRMVIPKTLGRALITGGGVGAGLTARYAGQTGGEETHLLALGEMPNHAHTGTPTGSINNHDINHTHQQAGTFTSGGESANHTHAQQGTFTSTTDSVNHSHTQQGTFGSGWQSADHAHYTSGTNTSGGMNSNTTHAHSVSGGVWGGTTHNWVNTAVYFDGVISASTIVIDATNIDHTHNLSWGNWSGGVNTNHYHDTTISGQTGTVSAFHTHNITLSGQTGTISVGHTHNTTISGATGYMDSNNVHSHVFTGNLMTTSSVGGGAAFNIMQPWTAWNVMIKL